MPCVIACRWRVIGRRVIEIRVCACPGRDRRAEERALSGSIGDEDELAPTPSKTLGSPAADPFPPAATRTLVDARRKLDAAPSARMPLSKRRRADSAADEDDELEYSVPVTGRRNFQLLMKIRDSLEVARQLERSGQRLSSLLHQHSSGESSASAGVAVAGLRCEERVESDAQRSSPGSSTPLQSSGGLSTLLGTLPNPHSQESVVKQELLIEMPGSSFLPLPLPQPIHTFQQALAQPYLQQVQFQPSNMALNYQFVQRPAYPTAVANTSAAGPEPRGYAMLMSAEGTAPAAAGAYLQGTWASAAQPQALHSSDRLPFEGCSVAVPMTYAQHTAATSWIPTALSSSAAPPSGGYDAVDSAAPPKSSPSNKPSTSVANDSQSTPRPEQHQTPAPASPAVDTPRKATARRAAQKQIRHDEVVPSILPGQQTRAIVIEISHETISETAKLVSDSASSSACPAPASLRMPGSCASDSDKENA